MARQLLNLRAMRTTAGSTNPWGNTIDDGWKDLVVSSAPPPPPTREEQVVKNRALPVNFNTWQEHGAARISAPESADEPSFSKGDRRMWVVAGTLMGAATLVLAVLGLLTFGTPSAPVAAPAVEPAPAAAAAVTPSPRAAAPSHPQVAVVAPAKSANPRLLKPASHSSRGRHHKRLAIR